MAFVFGRYFHKQLINLNKLRIDKLMRLLHAEFRSGVKCAIDSFMAATRNLTFSYPVPRGRQRLRELIVYIGHGYLEAERFGFTKLNKTLYHSDFRAYERLGLPLTGVSYVARKKGPAPKSIVPVLNELIFEGAVRLERRPAGRRIQKRAVPNRRAYTELFTGDELEIVDSVIRELWSQSADQVSDASHDVRWRTLRLNDRIPYEAVYLSDDPISDEDLKRTAQLANEYGWR